MSKLVIKVEEKPVDVNISENNIRVNVEEKNYKIELSNTGPQGPAGTIDYSYLSTTHEQASASTTWSITHNLGYYPSITVVDSSGNVVEGNYYYPNLTTIVASFSNSFAGRAFLS